MLTLAFGYCQTNPKESIYLLKEAKELLEKKLKSNINELPEDEVE